LDHVGSLIREQSHLLLLLLFALVLAGSMRRAAYGWQEDYQCANSIRNQSSFLKRMFSLLVLPHCTSLVVIPESKVSDAHPVEIDPQLQGSS
jgi:hypothetical protein